MAVIEGRTWLEILSAAECWQLVERAPIGRLAVVHDGAPEIFPINFVVHKGGVVFRTARGTKLAAVHGFGNVAFEVDGVDRDAETGWSVVVKGTAKVVRSPEEVVELRSLALRLWAPGDKDWFVRIIPSEITGRRIMGGQHPDGGAS